MLDCCCPRLPSQLLLVSKAVYKETSEILYSQNKFAARGHIGADLTPLLSMSSKDLGNIKSLLVRLNCFPCLWGHEGETYHAGKCAVCATSVEESDPELNSSTYQGRNLISQWKTLCRHLSSAISPGQLELTFICDCLDIVSGRQVSLLQGSIPSNEHFAQTWQTDVFLPRASSYFTNQVDFADY